MLIDTHVHLNLFEKKHDWHNLDMHCIVPATTQAHWQGIQKLAAQSSRILPVYGLHPWFEHSSQDLAALASIVNSGIAVGECGLDRQLSEIPFEAQLCALHLQLDLAQKYDLPVILHCVKAGNELLQVLKMYPSLRGVIHGFTGSVEQARAFIDLGFYIGISHVAVQPNATRVHSMLKTLPSERLLLESDAPNRHFTDATAYASQFGDMVETIARNIALPLLREQSHRNASTLFGFDFPQIN